MTSLAEDAVEYRRELSRQWFRAKQAGVLMGEPPSTAEQRATRERRDGRILGVWVPSECGYRYPTWQFRVDGTPDPRLQDILRILREHGAVRDEGDVPPAGARWTGF